MANGRLRIGGLGAGVDVAQHVAVLGLGERTAVLVLHDLALQEPLGVEPVGEVVAHDGAVEGIAGGAGVVVVLGDRGVAQELALQAVVARAGVGEGGDLPVGALAHVAVEDADLGEQPARLRQVVAVAVAGVFEVNGGAERAVDLLQQVGAADRVEGDLELAVLLGLDVVDEAVPAGDRVAEGAEGDNDTVGAAVAREVKPRLPANGAWKVPGV